LRNTSVAAVSTAADGSADTTAGATRTRCGRATATARYPGVAVGARRHHRRQCAT
jgi:hypothetical protein